MSEQFCTYFDHRYAPKGLAMWRSLKACSPSAVLHVLCLNDACRNILETLRLPEVHLHSLDALEAAEPDLLQARANRSLLEYYFTLTPYLPLHIFHAHPEISRLTYLDADLFFFADPQPILDEIGDRSIGVVEHRFPETLADLEIYGRFNVGWLTFTNDSTALACLDTWRRQCVEWCFDRAEPGRFAEQKYLDDWPIRFSGIHVIQHKGANVAPWNLQRWEISLDGDQVQVGGEPLLFFHAHGFQPASPGQPHALNLKTYGVEESPLLTRTLFEPYEKALVSATGEMATPLALALLSEHPRDSSLILDSLRSVVNGLRARLESSEADRAARLDVIHSLDAQLRQSEADRAAHLDVIYSLEAQLRASEADRAARLDVIHSLQAQLQESEAARSTSRETNSSLQGRLDRSQADIENLHEQLADSRSRLEALESSRSWRWTRPFRWVAGATARSG